MSWNQVHNQKDIDLLLSEFSGFHDSCICSAEYISGANVDEKARMSWERENCTLLVRFQSQYSIFTENSHKKSLELRFNSLRRLNLIGSKNDYFCDIFSCYLSFHNGLIVWADDGSFNPDSPGVFELVDETMPTFVVADRLEWRFV